MHNHDNPVSGNHLGTVTVLTSGTKNTFHILTKGRAGKGAKQTWCNEKQHEHNALTSAEKVPKVPAELLGPPQIHKWVIAGQYYCLKFNLA